MRDTLFNCQTDGDEIVDADCENGNHVVVSGDCAAVRLSNKDWVWDVWLSKYARCLLEH